MTPLSRWSFLGVASKVPTQEKGLVFQSVVAVGTVWGRGGNKGRQA